MQIRRKKASLKLFTGDQPRAVTRTACQCRWWASCTRAKTVTLPTAFVYFFPRVYACLPWIIGQQTRRRTCSGPTVFCYAIETGNERKKKKAREIKEGGSLRRGRSVHTARRRPGLVYPPRTCCFMPLPRKSRARVGSGRDVRPRSS